VLAGGIAGVAAVGAAAYLALRGRVDTQAAGPKSLAVLPFANLSEDKDAAYFADGIHEDLLTQLALLGDLKVVSRTSVMEYRNTTKKMPQIGSELGVAALVEGSVRKAGNQVRVTAQLVDAHADKHIWAANYDRDLKDIFRVQSELAKEIAGSLNVSLTASEERRLSRAPTQNLQAYELYLKHQQLMREVAGSYRSITSVNERVDLLQKAVELDPAFALAWAKLAAERARGRRWGMFNDREEQVVLARQAIAKARSLTPDDPQVKIEEAAVHLHGLDDHAGAIRLYEDVLRGSPYNVEALYGLSETMWELKRQGEGAGYLERALSVDARHGPSLTRLAAIYTNFRQFDRALQLRRRLIDMQPDNVDLQAAWHTLQYWKTGRWDSYDAWRPTLPAGAELRSARVRNFDADRAIARRDFASVHRLTDVDSQDWKRDREREAAEEGGLLALHALAWRAQGEARKASETARHALARLRAAQDETRDFQAWFVVAQMHALLGEREAAMAAFDKYVAARAPSGNQWQVELAQRRVCFLQALLRDDAAAIASLRKQSRRPGFQVHDTRLALEFALLWNHPDFIALVADPATNAPLPLDTRVSESAAR
jgi:TolB-like protein